jgi:microcystin-dependent protein
MSEQYLGEIRMFAGNFAINGWAMCNGQILSISQNAALFSILGTTYGGNGTSTFALPDLRGRVAIHQGTGVGLSPYVTGQQAGTENVTLLAAQVAPHTHAINANTGGNLTSPAGNYPGNETIPIKIYSATSGAVMNPGVVGLNSGGQPHPNIQPSLCVTFLIALVGIFPSRN